VRVVVELAVCNGSGNCVRLAPEVFDQRDEDGLVVLLAEQPPTELDAAVRRAAAACPTGAITIVDDDKGG
jgi:ferredoxin